MIDPNYLVKEQRSTDWVPFSAEYAPSLTNYRIHFRTTAVGFFQRHEWKHLDGSTEFEHWILCHAHTTFPANALIKEI